MLYVLVTRTLNSFISITFECINPFSKHNLCETHKTIFYIPCQRIYPVLVVRHIIIVISMLPFPPLLFPFFFFFSSFSDFLYFLFSFLMACNFFRFFFSIILIRFLCPRFLNYFICFESTCFVWFFDFLIACHPFQKKRKFRRRERTMPCGHGAVQSAEVGVMQIWFSFHIKNGGSLIRWLSFFRLTDDLLTW